MKKRKERETGPAREGEIPMHEHRPGLGDLVGRIEARDRDGAIIQHVFCRECGKIIRVAPKHQGLYNLIRVLTYIAPLLLIFYWGITGWTSWYRILLLCLLAFGIFYLGQYLFCRFGRFVLVPEEEYTKLDRFRMARREKREGREEKSAPKNLP